MATDIRTLDPDDPGYDAAVEAALREEDEADGMPGEAGDGEADEGGDEKAEGQTEATDEAESDATDKPQEAETQQQAGEDAGKPPSVAGVLGKGGKAVLPYTVLKGAREEARRERIARTQAEERAAQLEREIADLKAGKKPDDEAEDDGLDEFAVDFPSAKKLVDELRELRKKVAQPSAAPKQQEGPQGNDAQQEDPAVALQEAIDSVPLLAEWQHTDPDKWARAIEHDRVLSTSNKWKGKPVTERFEHVARIVADEFDVPYPAPTRQTEDDTDAKKTRQEPNKQQPSRSRTDPNEAVKGAKRTAPNTLSDFKGGAPDNSRDPIERLPATAQVDKFAGMSDDEIDAYLARLG